MSKKDLQTVAKHAELLKVDTGKVIVTEGAAGSDFFVILEGRARSSGTAARSRCSARAGSSATSRSSTARRANASVIAETPMELAKIGQRAFDSLLETPGFSKKLLAGLARRLRIEDAKTL